MIFSLILAAMLVADDAERQSNYDAMLSCAAFHTIEATRADTDGAEAQQAVAVDFAKTAVALSTDHQVGTVNADLEQLLAKFREELDTGDVRQMAEDWTTLESACRELYPIRHLMQQMAEEKAAAE
jgi:glutamate synthase domain-containing protein 3